MPRRVTANENGQRRRPSTRSTGAGRSTSQVRDAALTGVGSKHKTAAINRPDSVLAIDVGGTKVKILVTGQTEARKSASGTDLTPARLVETVRQLGKGWKYQAISIGYPGLVGNSGPSSEPGNLGPGWVGFDFAAAFGCPVKIVNDASMQALGSYEGGRMLFLGLGTGVGSTLISQNVLVNLELGQLPLATGQSLADVLGAQGLERAGKKAWREAVLDVVPALMAAFVADYVVLGGGNAKQIDPKQLRPGIRLGNNLTAFRGGFRLWHLDDVPTLAHGGLPAPSPALPELRLV